MNLHDTSSVAEQDDRLQRAFGRLAEASFDLLAVSDCSTLNFQFLNHGGRRLLGVGDDDDVTVLSWSEFVTSQFLPVLLYEAVPAAIEGREWRGDTSLRRRDGDNCPAQLVVVGLPSDGLRPDRIAIAAINLSASRAMKTSLQQEQLLLRAVLDHLPDTIYFKDTASRFIRVSASQARLLGAARPEDTNGKTDFDFFSHEHAQRAFDDEKRIMQTAKPMLNAEERQTWPDGRVAWGSASKLPLYDPRGRVIGTFGITRDITERKQAEDRLHIAQKELLEASRLAGMAEIASGVLHNIGNALNSVNTSVSLLTEQFARSRASNLGKVSQMIEQHAADLATFLTSDPRGKQLPAYIAQVAASIASERDTMHREIEQLRKNVEHIIEVVAMQQNYARVSSLVDDVDPQDLVEEALNISAISLSRHGVAVRREFSEVPKVRVTRHKVLQILVNLIRNAKYAMDETGRLDKDLVIAIQPIENGHKVRIAVKDNGVGIPPENLSRIFGFGFTTRRDGHGFGLHSSANAAKEIGGVITPHSDGTGKGAIFTLDLPIAPPDTPLPPLRPVSEKTK